MSQQQPMKNNDSLNPPPDQSSVAPRQMSKQERIERANKMGDFLMKLLYPDDEEEEE